MTDVIAEAAPEAEVKTSKPKAPKAPEAEVLPEGHVRARVLPLGHDKIYTGEMSPFSLDNKFPRHKKGDIIVLQRDIAEAHEKTGKMEILDA